MTLLPFFQWCEASAVGAAIRNSQYAFAVIEGFHLVGFGMIGGTILLVDMRLFGLGLRRQPSAIVWRESQAWLIASLLVMIVSGALMFLSEAVKCYYSTPFWVKMTSLGLAIVFTFTIRRRIALADEARIGPAWRKLTAVTSLILWGGVAWGGRWIGFS